MIAKTILSQLGGGRFVAMTGAKNFLDHDKGLSFRLPIGKVNYIKIILNSLDLYDIEFGNVRGASYKKVDSLENIYAEDLQEIISEKTGLALSL